MHSHMLPFQRNLIAESSHEFLAIPSREAAMVGSDQDRIRYIESILLPFPAWSESLDAVQRAMTNATLVRLPGGVHIVAESGMGKTFYLNTLLHKFPGPIVGDRVSMPILAFDLRKIVEPVQLVEPLLNQVNYPYKQRNKRVEPWQIFCDVARSCNVRIVAFDNVQLVVSAGPLACQAFVNFVRNVHDEIGLPFLLLGDQTLERLLATNPSLANCVPSGYDFLPFGANAMGQSILKTFAEKLPGERIPEFHTQEFTRLIVKSTAGNFRRLKALGFSFDYRSRGDPKATTKAILGIAHSSAFGTSVRVPNPFVLKTA